MAAGGTASPPPMPARPPCGSASSPTTCRTRRRADRALPRPVDHVGPSTTSTPAKASSVAPNRRPGPLAEHGGDSKAVRMGLVNWIAVASASGSAITAMKKQIVATAMRDLARVATRAGAGRSRRAPASRQRSPRGRWRQAITQRGDRRPRPARPRLTIESPIESETKPQARWRGRSVRSDHRGASRRVSSLSKFPPYSPCARPRSGQSESGCKL